MLKKLPHKNLFYFGFMVVFIFIGLSYWQLMRHQEDQLIIESIDSKDNINQISLSQLYDEKNKFEEFSKIQLTENIKDIEIVEHIGEVSGDYNLQNIIVATIKKTDNLEIGKLKRNFVTNSSCGVCGKTSLDAIKTNNFNAKKYKISLAQWSINGSISRGKISPVDFAIKARELEIDAIEHVNTLYSDRSDYLSKNSMKILLVNYSFYLFIKSFFPDFLLCSFNTNTNSND